MVVADVDVEQENAENHVEQIDVAKKHAGVLEVFADAAEKLVLVAREFAKELKDVDVDAAANVDADGKLLQRIKIMH